MTETTVQPSRVLYVAGVGHKMNTHKADVLAEFSAFGAVEEVEFVPNKRFCFVIFKETEAATAAIQNLSDRHIERFHGKLFIQYAIENTPRNLCPLEPECVSLTAEVVVPGLEILDEFLTEHEEQILLSDEYAGQNASHWTESLSRRVQVQYTFLQMRYFASNSLSAALWVYLQLPHAHARLQHRPHSAIPADLLESCSAYRVVHS